MSDSLVSVVIPTYNYGHFVCEAVDSALAQTYLHREIIVIDDGSTDDTRERLAPYRDRIQYIYQHNQGLSAARNAGIRAAKGEFVALLDSDDVWHARKLEFQMRYLANHPEVCLLASANLTERPKSWPKIEGAVHGRAHDVTVEELAIRSSFGPSGVVIAKHCFETVDYFDTTLRCVEDRDMWLRIASRYPVRKLELPLWWYRIHGANMVNAAARMEEFELKVLRKAFASVKQLRRRFLLKQKALGRAAYSAAIRYTSGGWQARALGRMLQSFLRWPFPYRRSEVSTPLARPKTVAVILLRLLRLKDSGARKEKKAELTVVVEDCCAR